MKRIITGILLILAIAGSLTLNVKAEGLLRDSEMEKKKVISVIFDDSTSMIRDDVGDKRYTTRWVEADYAVKALVSMMNEGDIFRLYIMGDYQTGDKTIPILEQEITKDGREKTGTSQEVETIENWMKNLVHINATWSTGIERAKKDFSVSEKLDKDCWIVVLTDGKFTKPEELNEQELNEKFHDITADYSMSLAYIPIGGNGAADIPSDPLHKIIVPEEKTDVTKQVTEIANIIYKRVQMDKTVSEKYLSKEDGKIIVEPNVPMEKMIAFIQYYGDNMLLDTYQGQKAGGQDSDFDIVVSEASPVEPSYLALKSKNTFDGSENALKWKTPENLSLSMVNYRILKGAVFTWKGDLEKYQINSEETEGDKIVIPVNPDKKLTSEVYYQPAVNVQYEYWQDGKTIEHNAECPYNEGGTGYAENCITAGELTIKLKLVDSKGEELKHPDSELLYLEKFDVTLYCNEEGSKPIKLERIGENYQYAGTVEQKQYHMVITTSWHEEITQDISVQEKRKAFDIIPEVPDPVFVGAEAEERSIIRVLVHEDGSVPEQGILDRITVSCNCENEDLVIEPLPQDEDGIWKFEVMLADPDNHQIAEQAVFHIEAARPYDTGGPAVASAEIERSLGTGTHVLSAGVKEGAAFDAFECLRSEITIPCVYACDGKILTEEQQKNLELSVDMTDPELEEQVYLGEDHHLHFKQSLKWWKLDKKQIGGVLHVKYHIYTSNLEEDFAFEISAKPVSKNLKAGLISLITGVAIWCLACLIKTRTYLHIGKINAYLYSPGGRKRYELSLKRKMNLLLPWYSKAKLFYFSSGTDSAYLPALKIVFRNNPEGDGWILCNFKDFANNHIYRIGGLLISEDNNIFSRDIHFTVTDKEGYGQELYIQ